MAEGIELATAYVRIVPTTEDISGNLETALEGPSEESGKNAGKKAGSGFSDSFGKNVTKFGDEFSKKVSVPITAGLTAAMASWSKVDNGLDIVVQKTGASGEALEKMQQTVKDLATTMPVSFADAGTAVGEINTRFGATGEQLEEMSQQFLKFAQINNVDVNSSIDNVQKAMSAFGLTADDAGAMLDTLNKVGQDTGISMDTLEQLMVQNSTALQSMGLNASDSAVLLGQLEKSGADVQTVMMGLTRVQASAMQDGVSMQEEFQKAVGSSDEAVAIFGTRAGAKLYELFNNGTLNADMFTQSQTSLQDALGSTADTFDAMQDPADQWQTVLNNLMVLGYQIGEAVMPSITSAVQTLVPILQKGSEIWEGLNPSTRDLIVKAALLSAAAGPVISTGGKLITGASSLASHFGSVASKAGGFASKLTGLGTSAAQAAPGVTQASVSFGQLAGQALSLVALGAGIALAGVGIKQVADAAVKVTQAGPGAGAAMALMIASIAGLAAGAAALGPALTAGSVGFVAFGAAVLGVGAGVDLAATGIAKLAEQLPVVSEYGSSSALAFLELAGGLTTFGLGSAAGAAGAVALGLGLLDMSINMGVVSTSSLVFNPAMKKMTEHFDKLILQFPKIKTGISGLKTDLSTMQKSFTDADTSISKTMDTMKKKVIESIDEMARKFKNTKFEFNQHIAIPHFSMSGGFNANGGVPSVSVNWYSKAMDRPIILDGATIFGASGNSLLGGGETGREVIMSEDYMQNMISNSSQTYNQNITINAPSELDPSEIARQTRNSTRELLLSLRGV
ncbi:MAG: phage tail tape measure protein [Eubacteriales bacterium]|nr:phage tail tape measure protein [Eubacteriales bacterium]